mmetsp:Transcript_25080/g.56248  ORF Transcript_25080/g.56248 Transcript_25080/m.56248 type:complete len:98 (+) Transcript_25080:366-659(+)
MQHETERERKRKKTKYGTCRSVTPQAELNERENACRLIEMPAIRLGRPAIEDENKTKQNDTIQRYQLAAIGDVGPLSIEVDEPDFTIGLAASGYDHL